MMSQFNAYMRARYAAAPSSRIQAAPLQAPPSLLATVLQHAISSSLPTLRSGVSGTCPSGCIAATISCTKTLQLASAAAPRMTGAACTGTPAAAAAAAAAASAA
jgi:hypothetical protein